MNHMNHMNQKTLFRFMRIYVKQLWVFRFIWFILREEMVHMVHWFGAQHCGYQQHQPA
jgi:hypothetical protein